MDRAQWMAFMEVHEAIHECLPEVGPLEGGLLEQRPSLTNTLHAAIMSLRCAERAISALMDGVKRHDVVPRAKRLEPK